jgi:hypothetical protein
MLRAHALGENCRFLPRFDADRRRAAAAFRSCIPARPLKIVAPLRWFEASRGLREGTLIVAVVVVDVVVDVVLVALTRRQAVRWKAPPHRTC